MCRRHGIAFANIGRSRSWRSGRMSDSMKNRVVGRRFFDFISWKRHCFRVFLFIYLLTNSLQLSNNSRSFLVSCLFVFTRIVFFLVKKSSIFPTISFKFSSVNRPNWYFGIVLNSSSLIWGTSLTSFFSCSFAVSLSACNGNY